MPEFQLKEKSLITRKDLNIEMNRFTVIKHCAG